MKTRLHKINEGLYEVYWGKTKLGNIASREVWNGRIHKRSGRETIFHFHPTMKSNLTGMANFDTVEEACSMIEERMIERCHTQ